MPITKNVEELKTIFDKIEQNDNVLANCASEIIKLKNMLSNDVWEDSDKTDMRSEEEQIKETLIKERVRELFPRLSPSNEEVDIVSHKEIQSKKSALIFGSINQAAFYRALERTNVTIVQKFQQSGLKGFLQIDDPGVCAAMSTSFAHSLRHGGLREWRSEIATRDPEFIQQLKEEQRKPWALSAEDREKPKEKEKETIEDIVKKINRKIASGDKLKQESKRTVPCLSTRTVVNAIENFMDPKKIDTTELSCLDARQMQVNCYFERTGLKGKGTRVNHTIMFSMAVDDKGNLDPNHLLCMDANAGIFKIPNNQEGIKQFMNSFDQHLAKEMVILHYDVSFLPDVIMKPEEKEQLAENIRENLAESEEFVNVDTSKKTTSYRTAVREIKPKEPEQESKDRQNIGNNP